MKDIHQLKLLVRLRRVAVPLLGLLLLLLAGYGLWAAIHTITTHRRIRSEHIGEPRSYALLWDGIGIATESGVRTVHTVDLSTGKALSRDYRWIASAPRIDEALPYAVFCDLDGRRGYLDARTGKEVIEGRWTRAWNFSEGVGAVVDDKARLGFIAPDGTYVIPPSFRYRSGVDFLFRNGYCPVSGENGLLGFIDTAGGWVHPPSFQDVRPAGKDAWLVKGDGGWGLMDRDLSWLCPPACSAIRILPDRDRIAYFTEGGVKQLRTFEGDVIEPFVVDCAMPLYPDEDSPDGISTDFLWFSVDEKLGLMDATTGEVILPAIFDDVDYMSGNDCFICCRLGEDGSESILFDTRERTVLNPVKSDQR